ncbi:ATP-binding protein [Mycobacterium sp.]|uniref:ATP-binding protein n=2 Tax=Mycobacterium sp. TaxID=1785 RepID=UPI003F9A1999
MTAIAACRTCGTEPREGARFCDGCGSPVQDGDTRAEYKQVTVLFADVVHSMDIAAAVGTERLREIMAGLVDRAAAVVKRYGGTVDKFTGDGIMAVFGAPVALEDHAARACLAALGVQEEVKRLAADVKDRDGIDLRLRVGLNSGQVIAGEIGSGGAGYTAIGEQVGLAQRMESVAPPGGVMLSASTARLVETVASLGETELVHIKGTDQPVAAQRLVALSDRDRPAASAESALVGRHWEMAAVEGLLKRAINGQGAVVTVVGSPGIGKSRLVREVTAMAATQGVEVFTAYCESHTTDIPFHVVSRLLRAAFGIRDLDGPVARAQIRGRTPEADPEDLVLFDDLLGIADPEVELPKIDPDARRRRLTALVNTASLARKSPAVYVIEDAHWIDEVSESMLADFLMVIPQTPSLVLVTYRPEYSGSLSRVSGAPSIALAPLSDPETGALVAGLVGPDPSLGGLATLIVERAAGNPFFAQEIVRDLAERDVLQGQPGGYVSTVDVARVSLPATVQATIAARIDRLDPAAKRTLNAAAVIGSRFSRNMLETLGIDPVLGDLVRGQFLDQITFTRHPEYVFHHPLIRTVAYESQLKSDRAELHRRLAAAIEQRDPASAEENAALIAEHLEAAGDLHAAYGWHMRAAGWSTSRDISAAKTNWQRARQIADRLPVDDPNRLAMQIAPRTLLCGHAWRIGGSVADAGFDELRDLCAAAGDKLSPAIGMFGLVTALDFNDRTTEAAQLAAECTALIESIGDPALIVGLLVGPLLAKYQAGEVVETLRLAQRIIDLADGDATMGNLFFGSPLAAAQAYRGLAEMCLGMPEFREDIAVALATARPVDPTTYALAVVVKCACMAVGVYLPDDTALRETADALAIAEQSGDPVAVGSALLARGITLVLRDGPESEAGYELLAKVRAMAAAHQTPLFWVSIVDIHTALRKAQQTDVDGAIELGRAALDNLVASGDMSFRGLATTVLVESLLLRGTHDDIAEAQAAIDTLAAVPTDPGFVLHELPLLRMRALLARAQGDDIAYRDLRDRYRGMAKALEFEGHIDWAEAMP